MQFKCKECESKEDTGVKTREKRARESNGLIVDWIENNFLESDDQSEPSLVKKRKRGRPKSTKNRN